MTLRCLFKTILFTLMFKFCEYLSLMIYNNHLSNKKLYERGESFTREKSIQFEEETYL